MNADGPANEGAGVREELLGKLTAFHMRAGRAGAVVVADAGGLVRSLSLTADRLDGTPIEVLAGPPDAELVSDPWFRGRILCPYNDRIPAGSYSWGGRNYQLPINSPEDGSAIHGLVHNRRFARCTEELGPVDGSQKSASVARLCLFTRLAGDEVAGYPFDLEVSLRYTLRPDSFVLEIEVRNTGSSTAPLSFGWHPYFTLGTPIDSLSLEMDSEGYVPVDESLNPTGEIASVAGTEVDFRRPRLIGSQPVDLALTAPTDGRLRLSSADHSLSIELLGDSFEYVQLFSHPSRRAIAIEPITAATNAFNIPGLGLTALEPGAFCSGGVRITRTA